MGHESVGNCIFCKIASGRTNSHVVFQDDSCIAFLDIHPVNPGHILIVPKRHVERFSDLQKTEAAHLFETAYQIYAAINASILKCEGANIFLSDGAVAGQEVAHTHLHIAPRYANDGHRVGFLHSDVDAAQEDELSRTAAEIVKNLR